MVPYSCVDKCLLSQLDMPRVHFYGDEATVCRKSTCQPDTAIPG
jgi:hypothetical protein